MKEVSCFIVLILLLSLPVVGVEYDIIEEDNRKGLVDEDGNLIIPAVYDDLGWSEGTETVMGEVIGYKIGEYWGLLNLNNIKITTPRFLSLYPIDHEHAVASEPDHFKLNEKFGMIDLSSGKTLVPFEYASLKKYGQLFVASLLKENILTYGLVNLKGDQVLAPAYHKIIPLSPHLFAASLDTDSFELFNEEGVKVPSVNPDHFEILRDDLLVIAKEDEWGIMNSKGKLLTSPKYERIRMSSENEIMAIPSKSWVFLDLDNQKVNELFFDTIHPLDTGIYRATNGEYHYIVNINGDRIFRIRDSEIYVLNDSLAAIRRSEGYGVINYRGASIIPAKYDSVIIHQDRLFLYENSRPTGGWRMADLWGRLLSESYYDQIHPLTDRYFAVKKNKYWGVTDRFGKSLFDPIYDTLLAVNTNKFLVEFHGEFGVVNESGDWKSYPRKGDLFLLDDDRYLVSSYYGSMIVDYFGNEIYTHDDYLHPHSDNFIIEDHLHKLGMINAFFQPVLPTNNDLIRELVSDSIYLFKNDKGWGAVNTSGDILFDRDERFEEIVGSRESFIGVKINGEYGFVDYLGRLRVANRYEGIGLYHQGLANVKLLGKWGCIDKKEKIIIQPYYDHIEPFMGPLAVAVRDGKSGIIDRKGKSRVPFEYDQIIRLSHGGFICELEGRSGLINEEGILKFYSKFDYIRDLRNGYVIVRRNGKYGVLSDDGIIKIPIIHDEMKYDPIHHVIMVSNRNEWKKLSLHP